MVDYAYSLIKYKEEPFRLYLPAGKYMAVTSQLQALSIEEKSKLANEMGVGKDFSQA
jgi:hypothetical protein